MSGAALPRFESPKEVVARLAEVAYFADERIGTTAYLADRLAKPILVEGPAGTGKTELAKAVAAVTGARLVRLQCYEGLDEAKALYEWDYRKQLLALQLEREGPTAEGGASGTGAGRRGWEEVEADIFSESFLLPRPLLEAIRAVDPVVLLIDEVDRVELETEALLLEVLAEYQVSIPELGTIVARQVPFVVLTSNDTRELSEALKRRCLYLHLDYPSIERERAIVLAKVPGITDHLADEVVRIVASLRSMELEKRPSVSETLDWARSLVVLGAPNLDKELIEETLSVIVKYDRDAEKVLAHVGSGSGSKDIGQKEPTGENPHEAMYEMHRSTHKHTH